MKSQDYSLGARIQANPRADTAEYHMANMIDHIDMVKRHKEAFKKLSKGNVDFPGFMRQLVPDLVFGLLTTLNNEKAPEKLKTQIRQDLLDRAGHSKITKAMTFTASMDPQTTKRELMNLIMTKAKPAGLKVERKDDETVIDGTASSVVPGSEAGSGRPNDDTDKVRKQNSKSSPNNSNK